MDLKIGSINVRGIGDKVKRRQIFSWLRAKKMSIYFIQEAHCTEDNKHDWRAEWGYQALFSCGSSTKRQVLPYYLTTISTFKSIESILILRDAL